MKIAAAKGWAQSPIMCETMCGLTMRPTSASLSAWLIIGLHFRRETSRGGSLTMAEGACDFLFFLGESGA